MSPAEEPDVPEGAGGHDDGQAPESAARPAPDAGSAVWDQPLPWGTPTADGGSGDPESAAAAPAVESGADSPAAAAEGPDGDDGQPPAPKSAQGEKPTAPAPVDRGGLTQEEPKGFKSQNLTGTPVRRVRPPGATSLPAGRVVAAGVVVMFGAAAALGIGALSSHHWGHAAAGRSADASLL